ncbi:hypothetical protein SAMN04515671_1208 [Nakamurella panacisegetis]|uniref:Polysaccharide deacetylase n=1 Tax=Nakamurella panacisegetis TaxID=1090615 RepID=A0A1H0K8T5_9ACTN|nr:polysaccharide deacetylase [Nakamurella panacisegetis]SDO52213.1 hypothetical protein SAMN04515671_1208 [Nakamurella panacisegetis]
MSRRSWRTRARFAGMAAAVSVSLVVSACTSSSSDQAVTVTSNQTVAGTSSGNSAAGSTSKSAATGKGTTTRTSPTSKPTKTAGTTTAATSGAPGAMPDGFVPTKLKAGEKAPQFIVVSFDGVGWHEKWQYWFDIMQKVPFHFTGFLSGTYMLSTATKTKYQGPGHGPGKASISWAEPSDIPVEIADINKSLAEGNEIGTHFNGHFCSDNAPGGNDWNTADWNSELDQFFSLVKNVNANNNLPASVQLNLPASEIKGERTPCLEGHAEDLFPALKAHGMTYDSSFTRRGISWPTQSKQYKIWQIGMAEFPIHGTNHFQITMDYNFYYTQENASSNGVSVDQSKKDSAQVTATYQDMYNATYNGNRAPLILGNHFNAWNNNAYSDAIGNFVLNNCGKPDTYCVPFRDLIAWMEMQDPARLAQLQAQNPELAAG